VKRLGLILLCLLPAHLFAEVIFINADTLSSNAVPPVFGNPFSVSVALLHFVPKDKSATLDDKLPLNNGMAGVVKTLAAEGKVNLLYVGTHSQNWMANEASLFDSLERRPAFSLVPDAESLYTNRQFGLHLQVRARPETNQQIHLEWEGNFSWSDDLIKFWSADKFLTFGMSVAKILKPGAVFTEGGEDDEEQSGINLRSLFGKKKKEKKEDEETNTPTNNVSFLDVDFQQVALDGKQDLPLGEVTVLSYKSDMAKDSDEMIYLLLQPITDL
jgi:hypothetical protein